jgi:hypothetical protein
MAILVANNHVFADILDGASDSGQTASESAFKHQ